MNNLLKEYKLFHAFDSHLIARYGDDLINAKSEQLEVVYCIDVINAIKKYRTDEITTQVLVDWVNTLWFCDGLYKYSNDQSDSIASVMTELETLDEEGVFYSNEEYDKMIFALENNIEYVKR